MAASSAGAAGSLGVNARTAEIRDTSFLSLAVVLGAALSPLVPFVGLPVAAAGLAALAYRGRGVLAAGASAVGIAAAAIIEPLDIIFVAPAMLVIMVAVMLLPRVDYQAVGATMTAVIGLAAFAFESAALRASGTSLQASLSAQTKSLVAEAQRQLGSSATADTVARLREAAQLIASAWPFVYFLEGLIVAVFAIVAISWAAKRSGRELNVPRLAGVDLTPHILWPFVAGVLMLAFANLSTPYAAALRVVGLNLVLSVRALFALQGLGVGAGVLDRTRVGLGGRILALAALAVLDAFTLVVSFVGLLDFWVNFRRLPRDGVDPTTPAPDEQG